MRIILFKTRYKIRKKVIVRIEKYKIKNESFVEV